MVQTVSLAGPEIAGARTTSERPSRRSGTCPLEVQLGNEVGRVTRGAHRQLVPGAAHRHVEHRALEQHRVDVASVPPGELSVREAGEVDVLELQALGAS